MFMEERLEEILEIIKREGTVKVKELSEKFSVSEGMIRKDLKNLEQKHNIKRTYGGAILEREIVHKESISSRVISNIEEKENIAKIAINQIEEDDVIFLDISSTTYIMARLMNSFKKNITIITNMNQIPMLFDSMPNIDVVMIGGSYNKKLGGTIGSYSDDQIRNIKIDKAFIGVGGINLEDNFISNFNLIESKTKETIIKSSKKNYLLSTKDKFYKDGSYKFGKLEDIDYIITDKSISENIIKKVNEFNIQILL